MSTVGESELSVYSSLLLFQNKKYKKKKKRKCANLIIIVAGCFYVGWFSLPDCTIISFISFYFLKFWKVIIVVVAFGLGSTMFCCFFFIMVLARTPTEGKDLESVMQGLVELRYMGSDFLQYCFSLLVSLLYHILSCCKEKRNSISPTFQYVLSSILRRREYIQTNNRILYNSRKFNSYYSKLSWD